ncbi:MAG: LysR family transcriptional regulator [Saccharopolyspora sp.]|uniref:LysR family transcriptional regulator n=1 Tax=Saccharopolyspora sp. TaxID=33915 RepID=UPI0025F004E2|nr:LysR family transcriptional regulator [Saccharopolyspora sp.]MBQ6644781.1 LysR family transcriptional regulator [Saccharopolyspora sp.]
MDDVDLQQLRAFEELCKDLHFTRAAGRLEVTQPTLTRMIRKLEDALGVHLVDRTTRNVHLTPAGQRLHGGLRRVLPSLDSVLQHTMEGAVLRLGFAWVLPSGWAQQVTQRFEAETSAQVQLVRIDDRTAGLDHGGVDVAVIRGEVDDLGLRTTTLTHETRVAVVALSHPLAEEPAVRWAELAAHPLVMNTVSGTTNPDLWPGHGPAVAVRCGNFDEWLEAVAAGQGVGVVPVSAKLHHPHPQVRYIPIEGAPPVRLSIASAAERELPLVEAFHRIAAESEIDRNDRPDRT